VKFQVVPSGMQAESRYQYLVSYVVNESVAIDAGCLGFGLCLRSQKKISDVFLTHCHLDHIASLPIFIDNVYEVGPGCVTVHGSASTLNVLQSDILNDRIWPDFVSLSTPASPFLKLNELDPGVQVQVGDLQILPLELTHPIPTLGFAFSDRDSTIAIISDTHHGTSALAQVARDRKLKAVFLECSFPDHLDWLADKAMHLIPRTFAAELRQLPETVRVFAIHIKPAWYDLVVTELSRLGLPNLEIAEVGKIYDF